MLHSEISNMSAYIFVSQGLGVGDISNHFDLMTWLEFSVSVFVHY